jgi:hypothetical protein
VPRRRFSGSRIHFQTTFRKAIGNAKNHGNKRKANRTQENQKETVMCSDILLVIFLYWLLKTYSYKKGYDEGYADGAMDVHQAEEDTINIVGCKDCRTINSCHGCDFLAKVNDGFYKEDGVGGL